MRRGFTIFFAMLIASLSLAVGLAIYDLTIRELDLSVTATQSQYAIYAADTGADCALYWDFNYTDDDESAFGTSTSASWPAVGGGAILCNGQDVTVQGPAQVDIDLGRYPPSCETDEWCTVKLSNAATTTFSISITAAQQTYCATVDVGKFTDGSGILYTTIISRGHNTCGGSNFTRIERALQVNY